MTIKLTEISRGTILHHYSPRAGKTKWFVVLNVVWPPLDGNLIYAFLTSQIDRFVRARVNPDHVVELEPGPYPMVKLPTLIDLTDIVRESFVNVDTLDLKPAGKLTDEHLRAVDAAVRRSTVVTSRLKKAILASYG